MTDLVDALTDIEATLAADRGEFDLFGLFRRRRALDWDVVAAAPWIGPLSRPTIETLVGQIKRVAGEPALMLISRIIVGPDLRFVEAVAAAVTVRHGLEIVGPGDYANVEIARGYVITSRRPAVPAVAT